MIVCRVNAQSGAEQVVTLDYLERPLRSVLEDLQLKTGINFIFQDKFVDSRTTTFHIDNTEARKAVILMLCKQKIAYKPIQRDCFVLYEKKKSETKEYVKVELEKYKPAMDTSVVISEPIIISSTILKYPSAAFKDKIEGKVILNVFINKEGKVPIAVIEKTSGCSALDSSAVAYSSSLRFIPAKVKGLPINIWLSVLFNYVFVQQ
jgi:TonB family protein